MKIKKRFTAVILALTLAMSLCVPAMAANSEGVAYTATLDNSELFVSTSDQTVVMTVKANKDFSIGGMGLTVDWPSETLTLKSIENSKLGFTGTNINLSNGKVNYATSDAEDVTCDLVVVATFTVPANTPAGTYRVGIKDLEINTEYGETIWEKNGSAYTTLTIMDSAPADPTKPTINVTGTYTYTGSEQTATVTGYDSATMNISGNKGTNAGDYTVSVTSKTGKWADGSSTAVTAAWKIEKATPSYTAPTGLTGTKGQALSTVSLPSGWAWKAPSTVMSATGNQTFAATFTPSDTTNYKTVDANLTVAVSEPAPVDPAKPTISVTGTYTYTGSEQTATVTGYDSATMNISGNKGTNAGDYTVSVTSKTGKWADGSSTAVTAAWKIEKATPSYTAPSAKSLTYNGYAQVLVNAGSVTGGTMQYSLTSGGTFTTTIPTGTNAGIYTVYYKIEGDSNHTDVDEESVNNIVIQKATITIKADDKSAYVGDTAPVLTYTVTGLAKGETLKTAPEVAYETTPDMTKSGTVAIKASGAEAPEGDNYNAIVYVDGKLTISNKSSSGGSGVSTYAITVESTKNGDVTSSHKSAAKGTTVTLTVEPDKGYTLETITATDASGNKLKLTEKDGKYTFTMPASKVTVRATFMEDNSMLNFFVDVPADAYYYDAVLWAAEEGITGGTSATTFSPNATCTRAQAVTFLWRAAGSPAPKSSAMPFTDVAADAYYHDAVLWAVEQGITKGTSDTTFSPNAKCTRAQIVTFLWRSQESPAADTVNPFTDVAADAYYNSAVLWAVENGITSGTTATTFSPNNDCTRAQIVTFLYRCME